MNHSTSLDAVEPIQTPRVKTPKKTKVKNETPLQYRLMIVYRFILALVGGYALAALSAIAIAEFFREQPANAAMSATLVAFCIQAAAFIWVFMVQKTLKASLGIVIPTILLWLMIHFIGN